jgi:hypothetical protein
MKTNLNPSEVSFLLDLLDCTMEKGSVPKDIFKYEKWNNVDSVKVHEKLMRMWETE